MTKRLTNVLPKGARAKCKDPRRAEFLQALDAVLQAERDSVERARVRYANGAPDEHDDGPEEAERALIRAYDRTPQSGRDAICEDPTWTRDRGYGIYPISNREWLLRNVAAYRWLAENDLPLLDMQRRKLLSIFDATLRAASLEAARPRPATGTV